MPRLPSTTPPPTHTRRYEIDLLEEAAVLKWHNAGAGPKATARGKAAREAAAPFIKWLREAEEEWADEADAASLSSVEVLQEAVERVVAVKGDATESADEEGALAYAS